VIVFDLLLSKHLDEVKEFVDVVCRDHVVGVIRYNVVHILTLTRESEVASSADLTSARVHTYTSDAAGPPPVHHSPSENLTIRHAFAWPLDRNGVHAVKNSVLDDELVGGFAIKENVYFQSLAPLPGV
jgi:hypothetical protein